MELLQHMGRVLSAWAYIPGFPQSGRRMRTEEIPGSSRTAAKKGGGGKGGRETGESGLLEEH